MVIIDQLRISDNGQQMYINAHVNKAEVYSGVAIKSVVITTASNVSETSPEPPTEGYIYKKEYTNDAEHLTKEIDLVLPDAVDPWLYPQPNLSGDLFFVYITCETITTNPCLEYLPCNLKKEVTIGVTFDENLLYQKVMGYTKELADTCAAPSKAFIDFILLWEGFKASVETEHFVSAIKFYDMLFGKNITPAKNVKPCGCHG